MRNTSLVLSLALATAAGAAAQTPATPASTATASAAPTAVATAELVAKLGSCAECHEKETTTFLGSIHGTKGVACHDCHGGDPNEIVQEDSMSPAKGYVGRPGRADIPAFCAKCHADKKKMAPSGLPTNQYEQYRASFHGKKVLVEGDTTAAVCTDCHGTHDVLSSKDPRARTHRSNVPATCDRCHGDDLKMNVYAIPTDQHKKWKTSFHGKAVTEKKDLTAAVCTDCHGKHDIANPEDPHSRVHHANVVKTCSRCHADEALMERHNLPARAPADYLEGVHGIALFKKGNTAAPVCVTCHGSHGALPPGVKNVAMVCGRCHTRSEEFYNRSMHRTVKGFRGCIECHGNHRIAQPGSALFVSSCIRCHPDGSPANQAGKEIRESFDKASENLDVAARELEAARGYGFALTKLEEALKEGTQAKIEVVPALHTLDKREAEHFRTKSQETLERVRHGVQEIIFRVRLRSVSLGVVLLAFLGAILLFRLRLERLERSE
ncbi:MAG: cytochrome c3 family protein [Candidatus Wallbacteria bacterium]|nr:cytochrome c3 family protein [Candidatus Wallbacteria bacterium]